MGLTLDPSSKVKAKRRLKSMTGGQMALLNEAIFFKNTTWEEGDVILMRGDKKKFPFQNLTKNRNARLDKKEQNVKITTLKKGTKLIFNP